MCGWYFKQLPHPIDTSRCVTHKGLPFAVCGHRPKGAAPEWSAAEPADAAVADPLPLSRQRRGVDAAADAWLPAGRAAWLQLRRVGSGKRLTFADGEQRLPDWMAGNALVTWVETDQPWLVEGQLIALLGVPLNLDENRQHPFHQQLAHIRAETRALARALPVAAG